MPKPRLEILTTRGSEEAVIFRYYQDIENPVPTFTMHLDGSMTYGPDANINEAAENFWRLLVLCTWFKPVQAIAQNLSQPPQREPDWVRDQGL